MVKKNFPQYPPFINRQAEQEYLMNYFQSAPTSILFLYGPKSTGKTTLIEKVYKQLPQDEYAISYFNMRSYLIRDFTSFRDVFFPKTLKDKVTKIVSGIKIDMGFFGRSVDDEAMLETNIFAVMLAKLREANKNGIRPVIIVDEFQYLRNVIIDKENNLTLVEELWKLFIQMTKVENLAHVVCLTSDSYYIEELYQHAKLKNTSKYYLIDHLSQEDIWYWLGEKEGLDDEIVEYFREHLGGSVREIWQALIDYKNTGKYKPSIQTMIQDEYAKAMELRKYQLNDQEKKQFDDVSEVIAQRGEYVMGKDDSISFELIKKLVDIDMWFYDVRGQRILPNSQSVKKGFEKMFA